MGKIIGQTSALASIRAAISSGRMPSALLMAGPAGVGKYSTAIETAKAMLCRGAAPGAPPKGKGKTKAPAPVAPAAPGDAPCDNCPSCHRVDAGTHADLYILTVPEGKTEIPIAEARNFTNRLFQSPMEGARKVGIIDNAEALSEEAQNSLLKTLEEPPEDTTIILVAENTDGLLATVRSRTKRINFARLADEAVEEFLLGRGADGAGARVLARAAQGSMGEALRLLEGSVAEIRREIIPMILSGEAGMDELADRIASGGVSGGGAKGKKALKERREDVTTLLSVLDSVLVDALRLKAGAPVRTNPDMEAAIGRFAGRMEFEELVGLEKEVCDAIIVLGNFADARLVAMRLADRFTRPHSAVHN